MGFLRKKAAPAVEVPVTAAPAPQPALIPTIVPTAMVAPAMKSNGAVSNGSVSMAERTLLA